MQLSDYTKFANEVQVGYVATNEGDQPRVRAFAMWYADETGFYFHTGSMKPIYQQLKKNPKVEVCYWKPDMETGGTGTMMRGLYPLYRTLS